MSIERARELLDALVKIDKWRTKPAAIRKRRYTRFGVRGSAMVLSAPACVSGEGAQPMIVQLRDVSRGGVGFLFDQPLYVDGCYRVTLIQDDLVVHSLPLFVRYCQQVDENAHLVGGEFGAEASLLMACGVSARDIVANDVPEHSLQAGVSADFDEPDDLTAEESDAA